MALPTDVKLIKITGNFRIGLGGVAPNTSTSKVEFQLPKRLRDPDTDPAQRAIIITETIVGKLDSSGNLKAEDGVSDLFVIATNDADLDPSGWTYTITETINGVPLPSYAAIIPFNAAGDTIDLTELINVAASGGTVAVRMNEIGGPPALEDDGSGNPRVPLAFLPANVVTGVSLVDGRSGVVTLGDLYAALLHTHTASQISDGATAFAPFTHAHAAYLTESAADLLYIRQGTPLYRPSTQRTTIHSMYWAGAAGHPFVNVGLPGGTVDVNDTSTYALGDRSIHLSSPNGNTVEVAAGAGGLAAFSAVGLLPVVWLRVVNPSVITQLRVWLGNSANDQGYVWNIHETSDWPWIPDATGLAGTDGWVRITLPFGRTTPNNSFPDLASLGTIRVDFTTDGTAQADVWWGGIGFADLQDHYERGVITLAFPGARKSCLTVAKPYMDRYGYQGVAPVVTETLRVPGTYGTTHLTLAEAHRLEDYSGWEVITMAHSKTIADQTVTQGGTGSVGYTAYAAPTQYADMDAARAYLFSQGFRSPDLMAYPQGAWDEPARMNVRSLFGLGITDNQPSNETLPVADPAKVRATRVTSSTTIGALNTWVEQIRLAGGDWGVLLIEDIVTTPANPWEMATADFQALVDKIASEDVEVMLLSEILAGA